MRIKSKISTFFIVALFSICSIKAQTLYWIGGSGNFNDSRHWSLKSGGVSSNQIPGPSTDVVFDDKSSLDFNSIVLTFIDKNSCKSFVVKSIYSKLILNGSSFSKLTVGGDYILNKNVENYANTDLILSSSSTRINQFNPHASKFKGNVCFKSGIWNLNSFTVEKPYGVNFEGGTIYLNNSTLKSYNVVSSKKDLVLYADNSKLICENSLNLANSKTISNNFKIIAKIEDTTLVKINDSQNKILMQSLSVMACSLTYTHTDVSCFGFSDATITVTIDPTCAPGPFSLTFNTGSSCISSVLGGVNFVNLAGPTVYTLGGLSSCGGNLVDISIEQGTVTLASLLSQFLPQTPSNLSISGSIITPPSCSGVCDASHFIKFIGATAPYTVNVNPPGTTYTVGSNIFHNITGLCGGVQTYVITDTKGCTFTVNPVIPFTPPIALTVATKSVNCNASCNGAFSVTPTGGTPNYTVNFSTGTSSLVSPATTASIGGLCPAVYSATITDTKACTTVTNVTIVQPSSISVVPTQTNLTCSGICNGVASVSVSGGTSPYTYSWSPNTGTASSISGLCAGTQTVKITDNNLCTITQTFLITQPSSVTIVPSVTNIICNGLCNGSASVSASGGVGAITFSWVATGPSTISTTSSITSQCAGTYTVFAKDASACLTSSVISITQPPALTLTPITQSVQCFGQCSGASTANVSGGSVPYSYTWAPGGGTLTGQGTASVSNLCPGIYTLSVTDGSNCPISTTLSIIQSSSITPNITSTSVTCNGLCNGIINSSPSGGLGPYTFTLVTPLGASVTTAPPFSGLCAGTYTLFIKDLSLCLQSQTITVVQPNPLVPVINSTSLTCFNVCNGSLAGSISGGTPGYTLSWNTPGGPVSGGVIGGLCAGNYTFLATDFNGCTTNSVVTLSQPTQITATINVTNPLCNGSCNGLVNAGVSGGTPGYTLNWSNGFTGNPNSGLCAGNYTLTVFDAGGCSNTFTTSLTAPSSISLAINTISASCAGSCNGSATVTASGGSPGYVYQFNTLPLPTTNTTGILGGFCAGGYIASVTDGNGCLQSVAFNINQPIALSVALTGLQTSCNACTGAATVSMANGTPTYAVAWTNTLGVTVSSNSVATNLCPGSYTATATDSKGCIATTSVNVAQTVTITVVSGGGGILCFGACTGSATANVSGGNLPYTYTWAVSSQTTQTAVNLCPGNYTVTASDALGCFNTSTISFSNPPNILLAPTQTNVSCFGVCNGAINSNASGGTGALSYSWSPGGATSANVSGLCAGTYTLKITDANGCNTTQTFTITQSPSVTATFTTTNPSACIANNGSICATASGGSGAGYTYTWSPSGGVGIHSSCYSNLTAGSYSLVVADGSGCTSTLSSLITNPSGPTLTAVTTSVNCFGGNTGAISVTATGVPAFTFTWSPAVSFVNIGNSTSAINLTGGTYILSATDGNTCITSQTFAVNQASSLTVNSNIFNVTCNGVCNGSVSLVTSGATPGYTYNWLPTIPAITGQGTGTVSALCAGVYTVNITDANSCVNTRTFNINQPIAITITTSASNVSCNGLCNGSITALASGGTGVISYSWLPVGAFSGSNTATVFNLCPNIYTVIATDANLCSITKTVQITQPPALTSTLNLVNATCSSSCNAIATHTVSGGTPLYNYSWSSGGATTSTLGNLCAGNYTATVTDANGCVSAKPFTVTAPAAFTGTLTPHNPLCNAACNGSITTTLAGAQGTVGYTWIPAGSGQNPAGLCANNYTLIATDANGCQFSGVTNLTQPAALLANVTSTNPACSGNCNGIAVSTPANAQGAVNYTWTPAAPNSATVTALCAGNYTVLVKDANGCQDLQTFTLTNPPVLTVNSSVGPSSCGSPNGSITVIAVGGTPNYTYTWAPPIVSTNSTVAGLAAGIYTVTINDSQGCTNTLSIPLSNANGPSSAPITASNVNCNGLCTGAASVNVAGIVGGTPGYTVSWLSPPSASTVNPQTGLCAGTYTAKVTDANSCILFSGVTITQPAAISILPNVGLPTCNGICNGSITLNTSGGVGPYSYTWSPAAPNSATLINACSGNYTINISDNNNCNSTQTLNLPAVLNMVASINSTNNVCFGNCNGISNITSLTGGTPPYNLSWSNGQSGLIANNLCNGSYSLIVTDASGCNNTFTSTILSPGQINIGTTVNQPLCGLCNGSSTVTATGGTAPLSYTWTNGSSSTVANGLCGGLYAITVTDALGCNSSQTVVVNNSSGITSDIQNITNELCFTACNGAATITAVGGTSPITYNWLGPIATGPSISGLCGGTYFVQMTDAAGCVRTSSVNINSAVQLTLSPFITTPGCGLSNGTINVVVGGGSSPYFYSWLPAGTSSSLTNIPAGSYTLTVTDSSPCSNMQIFNISNSTGPLLTYTQTNINCFGSCTGSIHANATSTAIPISYLWSNGATTPSVTSLCSGVITLTITDGNLCKTIRTFTINENPQLQIGASAIIQPICGLCNGSSTVSAIGGIAPYTYTWSNGSNTSIASGLCAGLYQVTIDDVLGCQTTQTVIINNSSGITANTQTVINEQCFGSCNGSATVQAVGGTAPISYNWLGPAVSNSVITNLCGGTYFLQMTDALGCIRNTSITINSAIQLTITPTIIAPTACLLNNGTISIVVSGGAPAYSYTWLPSGITNLPLNGVGVGIYTVNVTDSSPCLQSSVFTISNLTGPSVSAIQSNINCFNACTGSITATGTSTALPITYQWSNGATTSSVTGLCSGVITLTVTDGNLCKTIKSYTITENSQLTIGALGIQQPACGLCNGSSTVSALGGTAPYTYTWSSGSTAASTSSLCAGLYQVTINDVLGCQVTQTLVINNSSGITADTQTITNEQCFASCNGAATVVAVGGTAPISYNWIAPAVSSSSVVSGLCGGSAYFVQMTDAAGCIRNASVTINSAIQLTLTPTINSPSCTLPNGTINVVPTGGSPTYTFAWFPAGNTSSLTNIPAGSYTLTVTDNNLCSQTQVFNVNNVTGPLITSTVSNINCFNACTGSITAVGSSTALPVSYHWSNGATTSIVTGLCSGVITLTVTDNNGCETIQTFTVTENPQISIGALGINQPSCIMCNGSSTVTALGITPFSYTWTNGSAVNTASNLCAGLYQVSITDGLGCNTTQNVIINNSNGITGQTTNIQIESCFGSCNGAATVTAIGGTAPISYSWAAPSSTNSSVSGLCAGGYFVQMTDAQGCIRSTSININSATHLTLTPFVSLPNCTPGNNGTINVVPTGGVPTYSFSWSTGGTTSSLTNISAGSYSLTVTDNNLCSQNQVFNISNITGPLVTAVQSNINCFNSCTGSITANGTGTALPISYLWSNGVTTSSVTGLCSGVITLTVTDGNLCKTITSYTITDNPDIQFSLPNLQQPLCTGNSNGTITLIPSGGVLPYTYSWTPGGSTLNPLSGLTSGTFVAIVTDIKGCAKSQTVVLTDPLPISITSTLNNSSCSTVADGSASVTINGGTPAYNYNWFGPAAFTSTLQNLTNILSGTYSLNVTDNNGCIKTSTLQVVPTITISADAGNNATVCPTSSVVLTGTNSAGAVAYNWYLVPNLVTPIATTPTVSIPPNATGSNTYVLQTISSVSTCVATATVVIDLFPLPIVDAGPTYTIPVFTSTLIGGNPTSVAGNTFTWSPSSALNNPNIGNPIASNTVNTTYTVTVTDAITGCIASDTTQVLIYPEIVIPNGFSPNGDGKNDKWVIDNIQQFPDNVVEIYNRWGERLYIKANYNGEFDGRFKGKDLPVGTYYYIINLNHPAYSKAYTGPLTIFR